MSVWAVCPHVRMGSVSTCPYERCVHMSVWAVCPYVRMKLDRDTKRLHGIFLYNTLVSADPTVMPNCQQIKTKLPLLPFPFPKICFQF
jgi:hypothetical protein